MKPHKTKAAAFWLLLLVLLLWMVGIYFWRNLGGSVVAEAGTERDRLTVRAEGAEGGSFRSEQEPSKRRAKTETEESTSTPVTPVAERETETETTAKLDRETGASGSGPVPAKRGLKMATVSFGRLYDGYWKVLEATERRKSEQASLPKTRDEHRLEVSNLDREVMADIREAVARIARAEELDFVFDTSGRSLTGVNNKGDILFGLSSSGHVTPEFGMLPYADRSLDFTAKVLEELNRGFPSEVSPVLVR